MALRIDDLIAGTHRSHGHNLAKEPSQAHDGEILARDRLL